jgi:hypothetical protein
MRRLFNGDRCLLRPGMLLERRADERDVLRPLVERVAGAVHADEAAAAVHEVEERLFAGVRQRKLAAREREHQHVHRCQARGRDVRERFCGREDELTGLRCQRGEDLARGGNGIVTETRRRREHQHAQRPAVVSR